MRVRKNDKSRDRGKEDPEVVLDHPGFLLRRALQHCREIHTEVCADLDITTMQAAAIQVLGLLGATTQVTLGKAIDMEPPNVHGLARRLMAKGLVTLTPNENDARANNLELTASGKKLARQVSVRGKKVGEQFLAPLSKNEQKRLQILLFKLIHAHE